MLLHKYRNNYTLHVTCMIKLRDIRSAMSLCTVQTRSVYIFQEIPRVIFARNERFANWCIILWSLVSSATHRDAYRFARDEKCCRRLNDKERQTIDKRFLLIVVISLVLSPRCEFRRLAFTASDPNRISEKLGLEENRFNRILKTVKTSTRVFVCMIFILYFSTFHF